MFVTWSTRRGASVDDSFRDLARDTSSTCRFSKSGLRDKASAKTSDFPGLYATSNIISEKNVSHLAILGDRCGEFIAVRIDA